MRGRYRFAVQLRNGVRGWRLLDGRFATAEAAEADALCPAFANVDHRIVQLVGGAVVVVSETLAIEKRRAS